jgi:hypothetical protein
MVLQALHSIYSTAATETVFIFKEIIFEQQSLQQPLLLTNIIFYDSLQLVIYAAVMLYVAMLCRLNEKPVMFIYIRNLLIRPCSLLCV